MLGKFRYCTMAGPICKYNQRGFCRYGVKCRQRHVNESCSNSDCQDESCLLRHPYKCRYFYLYGDCKFGDDCAYVHGESEDKLRIRSLEEKLSLFEAKVILLERSISELVVKLDTFMCMEGDESVDGVTEVVMEREPSLKQSEGSPIAQFDGNVTVNEEVATMTEAVGIDVVKSDNVVETPRGKIWIKPEDMVKKTGIGSRKK